MKLFLIILAIVFFIGEFCLTTCKIETGTMSRGQRIWCDSFFGKIEHRQATIELSNGDTTKLNVSEDVFSGPIGGELILIHRCGGSSNFCYGTMIKLGHNPNK